MLGDTSGDMTWNDLDRLGEFSRFADKAKIDFAGKQ
jgi:hypothetical protein